MAEARGPMGLRKDLHIQMLTEDDAIRQRHVDIGNWSTVMGGLEGPEYRAHMSQLPITTYMLFSMHDCRWKDVHGRFPTGDDVDAMFRDFVPMQLACLRQYSELLPGCADAIKRMKEDLKLKIGSSTGKAHTEIGACSKQYRCISNVHSKMPHHQLYWNDTTYWVHTDLDMQASPR